MGGASNQISSLLDRHERLRRLRGFTSRKAIASCGTRSAEVEGVPQTIVGTRTTVNSRVVAASFSGLIRCRCALCPHCGPARWRTYSESLRAAMEAHLGRDVPGPNSPVLLFMTLTFPHAHGDSLDVMREQLAVALRRIRQRSAFRRLTQRHGVRLVWSFDLTWGEGHGWHPHVHALIAADLPTAPSDRRRPVEELRRFFVIAWSEEWKKFDRTVSAAHGVQLELAREVKHLSRYLAKLTTLASEVAKPVGKRLARGGNLSVREVLARALDDARPDVERFRGLWREVEEATLDRPWINGLGEWRKALGLPVEHEDAAPHDEAPRVREVVVHHSGEEWAALDAAGLYTSAHEALARGKCWYAVWYASVSGRQLVRGQDYRVMPLMFEPASDTDEDWVQWIQIGDTA